MSLIAGNYVIARGRGDRGVEFLHPHVGKHYHASDLLGISFTVTFGMWLKDSYCSRVKRQNRLQVTAKIKKGKKHDYPWPDDMDPNISSGHLTYLSHFKPMTEKPKPVTLAFEKPLVDLEKKIIEVRRMADETGLDFSDQIASLENKYQQALKELYRHLTPIQRLTIARHPNRPTVLDHIFNITEKWVELHGDRAGYNDPAIVTGIGTMDGKSYMFIGHQKGRNTKENIARNFAMPTPHGYRKALRMMKYADHHKFPIVTFVDTPGAFADLKSEELGQGEAIAHNLRTMFGLKVPIITVVTGEGGSGGALAIACANKLLMLENSAFYVASPEACGAILWKSSQAAPKAAEKLRITAQEHYKLKIADGIIPEPLGGAHTDPTWTSQQIKHAIDQAMKELSNMDSEDLLHHRMLKFRSIGGFQEGIPVEPERKRNMKPSDVNTSKITDIESELQSLKKKILEAKGPTDPISNLAIEKVKQELDEEITNAFISMGLQEKLQEVQVELSKASPNKPLSRNLKEKADKIMLEFNSKFSQPGSYLGLKQKLQKLDTVKRFIEMRDKREKLKAEINQKVPVGIKAKIEHLKNAQEKLSKGESADKDLVEEVKQAKKELEEVLKSAKLEIVGVTKRKVASLSAEQKQKIVDLNKDIVKEIARVVDKEGLQGKLEELKGEIAKGSSSKAVEEMAADIRKRILSALDDTELKGRIDIMRVELESSPETDTEGKVGVDNGRW